MIQSADIVVIGAGVIGLSTAYELARRSTCSVVVVDKGTGLGEGSTGASSSVCRFRYTRNEMVELARDGINAYQNWGHYLETNNPQAIYQRQGNVWLGAEQDTYAGEVERLSEIGVECCYLDDDQLTERFPAFSPCMMPPDLETGEERGFKAGGRHLLEEEGGYMEPVDVLTDLADACRRRGVEILLSESVIAARPSGSGFKVDLASGLKMGCGTLVNAAGPWAERVNALMNLETRWAFQATRIQIVQVDRPTAAEGQIPICADPAGGIYFRTQSQGQKIVIGSLLPSDEQERVSDADNFDRSADDIFVAQKLHALAHRLPSFNYEGQINHYSGLYTVNTLDMHPVVGSTPITNYFIANGFSGHGFKIAPAIGQLLAKQITGISAPGDTNTNPSFLSWHREPINLSDMSVCA
ncbi:MAG: FAD-dependent oxidoreductase [Pseudomonadota bacterium]